MNGILTMTDGGFPDEAPEDTPDPPVPGSGDGCE
jgi:hypothetical protein